MAYIDNKNKHKNPLPRMYNNLVSNNSLNTTNSDFEFFELEPAEVLDVILDDTHPYFENYEDIGKIRIRMLYSQNDYGYDDIELLPWAKPGESNIKCYPLKHEVIIVANYITREGTIDSAGPILTPKGLYYFARLNVLNSVNHNAMQDISLTKEFKQSNKYQKPENLELGDEFKANDTIHPLKAKEGDIIYEGRFGQSIRFGSNTDTGKPETLIRTGQRFDADGAVLLPIEEDINKDDSSIWITSDRTIPLKIACNNQKAYNAPSSFDDKQIIINSDRIIFNAKLNELIGYSNSNINFSAEGTFTINSNQETIINSKAIYLGLDASEKIVLGDTLKDLLGQILDAIGKITVLTGTGPSSPPSNAAQFIAIKTKLSTILSKQNYTL